MSFGKWEPTHWVYGNGFLMMICCPQPLFWEESPIISIAVSEPRSAVVFPTISLGLYRRAIMEFRSDAGAPLTRHSLLLWKIVYPMEHSYFMSFLTSYNISILDTHFLSLFILSVNDSVFAALGAGHHLFHAFNC